VLCIIVTVHIISMAIYVYCGNQRILNVMPWHLVYSMHAIDVNRDSVGEHHVVGSGCLSKAIQGVARFMYASVRVTCTNTRHDTYQFNLIS
jgi:presenilin-like A22 family membrane protease